MLHFDSANVTLAAFLQTDKLYRQTLPFIDCIDECFVQQRCWHNRDKQSKVINFVTLKPVIYM